MNKIEEAIFGQARGFGGKGDKKLEAELKAAREEGMSRPEREVYGASIAKAMEDTFKVLDKLKYELLNTKPPYMGLPQPRDGTNGKSGIHRHGDFDTPNGQDKHLDPRKHQYLSTSSPRDKDNSWKDKP